LHLHAGLLKSPGTQRQAWGGAATGERMRGTMLAVAMTASLLTGGAANAADKLEVGAVYRDVIQFSGWGNPQIALPEGDWKLIVYEETRSEVYNIGTRRGFLINVKGNVLAGRILFSVPDGRSPGGWAESSICTNQTNHGVVSRERNEGQYDCSIIRHIGLARSPNSTSKALDVFYDYLSANQIERPMTAIDVTYAIAKRGQRIELTYLFYPELYNFTPASSSVWHPDNVWKSPEKAEFVDRIKAWATTWKKNVDDGFSGRLRKASYPFP
jgi:hypothetical protein